MRAAGRFAWNVLAAVMVGVSLDAAQNLDRRQLERAEETLRQEGEAVLALADAAAAGHPGPTDFEIAWHNDFLKAQAGTFIPFVVRIAAPQVRTRAALLYLRATTRGGGPAVEGRREDAEATGLGRYPFEAIYPVEMAASPSLPVRVTRGFSLPPGEYDLTVVVREREREAGRPPKPMASVLRRPLSVPDFATGALTTSSIILADGLADVPEIPPASQLLEHPYVVGGRDIQPAEDAIFRRQEELIVVFLVYNPAITPEKHFDLEVEYHFFKSTGEGETYFNRTEPQRFNPAVLGPHYDPSSGQPVMAGQGVPLAGFEAGDYRLAIKVRDFVSGRFVERQLRFSVRP
jgi:hypothetical protein